MNLLDYHVQWMVVAAISIFLFSMLWMRDRFGLAASLLFMGCAYSSIWVWIFVENRYVTVNPYDQMALRYFACDSLAKIMIICVPLMVLSENRSLLKVTGETVCFLFAMSSSLMTFYQFVRFGCNGLNCGGLIGNASISMGFMACTLPVFISSWRRQWLLLAIAAAAVLISKSSVAAGLLAAYSCLWLFPWKLDLKRLVFPVLASLGILGIARISAGKELLNDSDRFKLWAFMLERWRMPWNIPAGTGLGTYHVLSINLQQVAGGMAKNMWWNTFHNDWLQMLFECGVIGAVLLFCAYCSALFKVLKEQDWRIAISIILFGLYMFLDPALHNPLPVLFGAWLFVYALRKPTKENL